MIEFSSDSTKPIKFQVLLNKASLFVNVFYTEAKWSYAPLAIQHKHRTNKSRTFLKVVKKIRSTKNFVCLNKNNQGPS